VQNANAPQYWELGSEFHDFIHTLNSIRRGRTDKLAPRHLVRRTTTALLSAAVAGVALAPLCEARADAVDTGQLVLQMKFKPGETLKYQTNMVLGFTLPAPMTSKPAQPKTGTAAGNSLGGTSFTVNAVQDIKVRRAGTAGGGDLDVTTTGQNSLPGQPPVISNDTRPALLTYDAQGKLTSIKRQGETASSNPMFSAMLGQGLLSMQGVILPAKAVRIGETWTQQVKIPGITGSKSSTIKTTLVRVENLGKYRTARLHIVITTPVSAYLDAALQPAEKASGAASTMTGTAVVTDEVDFAIAEGMVVKSVSKGLTTMSVAIGRPTLPDAAPPKKRKKGAAPASVAAPPAKPSQVLQMTVHTDIETNLAEPVKKLPGAA